VDAVNRIYRISGLNHNTSYSIRAAAISSSELTMSSKSVDTLEVTTVSLLPATPSISLVDVLFNTMTIQLDTVYASSVGILDFGAYWSPDTAGSAYTTDPSGEALYVTGLNVGTAYTVYGWVTNSYGQSEDSSGATVTTLGDASILRTAIASGTRVNSATPIIHFKSSEDGSIVMASADQTTVNISRDYGLTWELTAYPGSGTLNYSISPDGQVMVIMTDTTTISNAVRSIFVAVSTDSGYTWTNVTDNVPYLGFARSVGLVYLLEADMVCSNAGGFLFATRGNPNLADDPNYKNYIWATADAGATFSLIASSIYGSTAGINLIWYSADLTLSRIAYVLEPDLNGRSYGAVYVTDDFGATATDTGMGPAQRCYLSGDGNTLVLRNANGSQLFICVYADGTWTRAYTFSPGYISYCSVNFDGTKIATLISNVVYYSADAGATFSSLNAATGETYSSLFFQKSATTVVPLAVRKSSRAIARCDDFFSIASPTAADFNVPGQSVTFYPRVITGTPQIATSSDMSVVYISALNNNTIQKYNLRSLDSGKSFTEIYSGPNSDGAVSFEFYACNSSGQIVYALDNINNKLYKSTDYGASWANIGGAFGGIALTCSSDGVFVICSSQWSRDSGATWSSVGLNNLLISNFDTRMLDDGGFWAPNNVNAVTSLYQGYYDAVNIRYLYNTIALPSVSLALQNMVSSTDGQYVYLMSKSDGISNNPSVQGAFVRSLDGGATFEVLLDIKFKAKLNTMSCSNDGSVIIYSDGYQNLYRSVDYGSTWSHNEEWTASTIDAYGNPLAMSDTVTAPDGSSKYILKTLNFYKVYS
jgi:hypothetical protein